MRHDRRNALLHKRAARAEPRDSGQIQRARFVFLGQALRLQHAFGIGAGAALAQRAQRKPRANVQPARAHRAEQRFVARKRIQIAPERAHIYRHRPERLRAVDQIANALAPRHLADRRHGLNRAGDVAGVGHGDQPRVFANGGADIVGRNEAVRARRHDRKRNPPPRGERAQRPQHRIVLQLGRNRVVAVAQYALDREVQRVGAVEGKRDARGIFASEQIGERFAAGEHLARGGERGGMPGAAGIGVEFGQSRLNAVEHDLRLGAAGGGVVEIQIHSQAPFTRRGGRA